MLISEEFNIFIGNKQIKLCKTQKGGMCDFQLNELNSRDIDTRYLKLHGKHKNRQNVLTFNSLINKLNFLEINT